MDEMELKIWQSLKGYDKADLIHMSEDEFINTALGKVQPGEIIFDYSVEEIISFWFNRCVNRSEALRSIIDDIACYFKDQLDWIPPWERSELKMKATEIKPEQLRLNL